MFSEYQFVFLHGLKQFVINELNEKLGKDNFEIISSTPKSLVISSQEAFVENFRIIKSANSVSKGSRKIALDKPLWRKHFVPAGLNPSLAWCMCKFAEVDNESLISDPFCGSGVIGLCAASEFNAKSVQLSDKSGAAIDTAQQNLKLLKYLKAEKKEFLTHDINIFRSEISKLNFGKKRLSHIITNPPFGVRIGTHGDNLKVYKHLRELAEKYLSAEGCLVLISQEKKLTEDIFQDFSLQGKFDIESGGLKLRVWKYMCERITDSSSLHSSEL